jgi:hypothetical protein
MAKLKNSPEGKSSAYKIAAAARRAKIALAIQPIPGEVKPSNGRIHVTLSAAPMAP